jgi:hypothetical protein
MPRAAASVARRLPLAPHGCGPDSPRYFSSPAILANAAAKPGGRILARALSVAASALLVLLMQILSKTDPDR